MATFNHTRGDSPRTPCAKCAIECGWTPEPSSNAFRCPKCRGVVAAFWLEQASERGEEHVCVPGHERLVGVHVAEGPEQARRITYGVSSTRSWTAANRSQILERIIEAANHVASQTGANKFIAVLGTIEWDALMEQEPLPGRAPKDEEVIVNAPAGKVSCSHSVFQQGIAVLQAPREPRTTEAYAAALTDEQLIDEARRRKLWLTHANGLPVATDEQLRAECARRGIDTMTPEMTAAWAKDREQYLAGSLAHAHDDALRAECERRFGGETFKQSTEILNCKIGSVERERDEWKRRAEEVAAQYGPSRGAQELWPEAYRVSEETYELWRSAPAAKPDEAFDYRKFYKLLLRSASDCKVCGAPAGAQCTKECDDDSVPDADVRPFEQREAGPGIAAKRLKRDDAIDIATLADMLADDE